MRVVRYRTFDAVKKIYQELSELAYPYWSYESIASKMKTIKYKMEFPKVHWFVVYEKDSPVLIAPLYIHLNEKLVRVMGDVGYNICDFQYIVTEKRVIKDAFNSLFSFLKEEIFKSEYRIKWWYILEESISAQVLKEMQTESTLEIVSEESVKNTIIPIGDNYNDYFGKLSKHVKQNVRTAYNRVHKDGYEVQFNYYENYRGRKEDEENALRIFKSYMEVYVDRQNNKYKNGIRKRVKGLLIKYFHYDFNSAFYSFSYLADITINGKIAAMVKCYKDTVHKQLIIPMLAIDENFYRYSPGMILVNELAKQISERTDLNEISLGRGDEKYKYDMGGCNYATLRWNIKYL